MFVLIPSASDDYFEIHGIENNTVYFTGLFAQKERNKWVVVCNPDLANQQARSLAGEQFPTLSLCLAEIKKRDC